VYAYYFCGILYIYWACRILINPEINCGAYKLTRTSRVIYKKKKRVQLELTLLRGVETTLQTRQPVELKKKKKKKKKKNE